MKSSFSFRGRFVGSASRVVGDRMAEKTRANSAYAIA
eukprot:COSAG02_NODE_75787_length_141_cov_141.833333_1_plen_36_part_01